jgi:catechol 2,3-dioxygenase-like lactoylglutathione lyase family enzyme
MANTLPVVSRVGVHSLDHFALEVPDLTVARDFFTAFGLDAQISDTELFLRAAGQSHVWARVFAGPRKRLAYLSFNCFADDFEPMQEQLRSAGGLPAQAPGAIGTSDGCWISDPDGNLLQVRIGPRTSKSHDDRTAPPLAWVRRRRGASLRSSAPMARPTRLSHVLLFTPDVARACAFYCSGLGLKFSDGSQGVVAFMHGRHGSDHHLVAFAHSQAKGWHHSAWEVTNVEEVGLGWMQMQRAGYVEGWGVGRHVLGSNYFRYVRDPWGSFCEYSAEMDFVPPGYEWPVSNHAPEDALYLWGPDVPSYFLRNTEISAA